MTKAYRHGEVLLAQIDALPEGLTASKEKVFMKGSHGHDHSIDKGTLYFKQPSEFVFGYLVAKNTKLLHKEHSLKGAKIEDGVYEMRKQHEYQAEGFKPITD